MKIVEVSSNKLENAYWIVGQDNVYKIEFISGNNALTPPFPNFYRFQHDTIKVYTRNADTGAKTYWLLNAADYDIEFEEED